MIHHHNNRSKGFGGKVEKGETIGEGAKRELLVKERKVIYRVI